MRSRIGLSRDAVATAPGSVDEDRDAAVARSPRGATDVEPAFSTEKLTPLLRRGVPAAPAVTPTQAPPVRDAAAAPSPSPDAITTVPSLDPIVPTPPPAPITPAPAAAGSQPTAAGLTIGELHVEVVPTSDDGAPAQTRPTAPTPARPRSAIGALGRVAPSSSRFRLRYR